MAAVAVATLGILSPALVRAEVPGYTFKVILRSDGPEGTTNELQSGDVNNIGQFCGDVAPGEREFVWDGTQITFLNDQEPAPVKLPDGASLNLGIWSPQGINNNGIVAWINPVADGTGPYYVMAYDIAKKQYTTVARPQDPAPGGGVYQDTSGIPINGRMVADINDNNEVFWVTGKIAEDGESYCAIYSHDLDTKESKLVAARGMKTTDGKTIGAAYWPDTNNSSMCTFTGNVDGSDSYGTYLADGKGNIEPIFPAGSQVGGVTIGSARWARINNNGDVVATVDVDGADQGPADQASESVGVAVYLAADKSKHLIVKPGAKIPGGTYHGQEANRRTQGITDKGEVWFLATLEETAPDGTSRADGLYRWDPATKAIDALVLGNTTVGGLKFGGVTTGNSGSSGYHIGVSGNGHLVFGAFVDGGEGYVLAIPPKP
jgi:hypothetical protein